MTDADPIAAARARFVGDTDGHQVEVLLDQGLYRHVRFAKPGTSMYSFSLHTSPGLLMVTGDCDTYVFSRLTDMFEFFRPPGTANGRGGFDDERWGINPDYWSEKLRTPNPDQVKQWSEERFKARVLEWYRERRTEIDPYESTELRNALTDRVLDDDRIGDASLAMQLLVDFEHEGIRIQDAWEWGEGCRDWRFGFLWCCWAIVWGIGQYDQAHAPAEAAAA